MKKYFVLMTAAALLTLPGVAFAYPTSGVDPSTLCTPFAPGSGGATVLDHVFFTAGTSATNGGIAYPGATGNFCQHYAELKGLLSSALVGDLCSDPEWGSLCALLGPCVADINGTVVVDDSGSTLSISVIGNGISDASNELAIISTILANPSFDNGTLTYAEVLAAYEHNFYQIQCDLNAGNVAALSSIFPQTLSGVAEILAAHITLGHGTLVVDNSNPGGPIYNATGSWGIAAGIVLVLCPALEDFIGEPCTNPNLNQADYIIIPELQPDGDADGDGASNQIEATVYAASSCGSGSGPEQSSTWSCPPSSGTPTYLTAVLDPNITPVLGSGSAIVASPNFPEEGQDVTLTVYSDSVAVNVVTAAKQWQKGASLTDISGETGLTLLLPNVTAADNDLSYCEVDGVPSAPYFLQVLPLGSVPVGGGIGMGLLAGACALAGALGLRRKS